MSGKVYLVGAGPGDPELLTLKAARCLSQADVVVYDFLANPALLELAPASAERIYVGKKGGDHTKSQDQINELLCRLAAAGKTVCRLKGGDPFVFGRGGEEASALKAQGHAFEVVPGISSAVAAPAYAGIPVTDRRCTTDVAFVTGHEDPTKPESTINWEALAGIGTVVFLMGVKNLAHICQRLVQAGKPPETPAATIRWGSTPRQRTVSATLADLAAKVQQAGLTHPAVTVVGPVAGLRPELNWYETLPLFGKRVLVTRTRKQASQLSLALRGLGAEVLEVPTIVIQPPQDPKALNLAVAEISTYDWLLFTSVNGVEAFFSALNAGGKDVRSLGALRLGAIGPATAGTLRQHGLSPEVVAKDFVAEGLLQALAGQDLNGARVLLPRAAQARDLLPETLRQRGAEVKVVEAYQTVAPPESGPGLSKALKEGLDVITFTASSTVNNLWELISGPEQEKLVSLSTANEITIAAIGPITADTARDKGLLVHVQPESYTIPALVDALAGHFTKA
ncbi:MAG: uroporphyrinogen-III C-methyltransferase [Desulfarculaceae bacterium]|jgi:uroporphyrinogen III methyltransferase/synthase